MALVELPGAISLRGPLGQGGMSTVWSGIHQPSELPVAVKILAPAQAKIHAVVEALRSEVRAIAALQHPHIVRTLDFGVVPPHVEQLTNGAIAAGSPYIVLERIDGGSLKELTGVLSWSVLRTILLQMLSGLAHAHARGVLHRDLKPANILVSRGRSLSVKITDYGLAHTIGVPPAEDDPQALTAGTPAFMAPEQRTGAWWEFGPGTDLYGLGCTAWMLACGFPPFGRGQTREELEHAHLFLDPPPLQTAHPTPPAFENWLRTLLRKAPIERFSCAADAAYALQTIDPNAPSTTAPTVLAVPVEFDSVSQLQTLPSSAREVVTLSSTLSNLASARVVPPMPERWNLAETIPDFVPPLGLGTGLYPYRVPPLVGRIAERNALWSALREAREAQRPRFVLLEGAPGAGRSHIARWIAERAEELGAAESIFTTHASVPGPEDPFVGALARRLRVAGVDTLRAAHRLSERLLLDTPHGRPLCRAAARIFCNAHAGQTPEPTTTTLLGILQAMARERPLVLVIDDVEYAREGAAVFELLLKEEVFLPALCVATVTKVPAWLEAHRDKVRSVHVAPSTPTELAELLRSMLGLAPSLALRIEERTTGSPARALRLVAELVQQQALVPSPRGYVLAPGKELALHTGANELPPECTHAWNALAPSTRSAIIDAAVLGVEFSEHELLSISDGRYSNEALHEGSRLLLFSPVRESSGLWRFNEASYRDQLLALATQEEQREAQQRIAAWLATQGPACAERQALHLARVGENDRALQALFRAATHCLGLGSLRRATRLLDTAEELLNGTFSAELALLRVRMDRQRAHYRHAESAAEALARFAVAQNDSLLLARARREQGRAALLRGNPRAKEWLQEALSVALQLEDDETRLDALLDLADGAALQERWSEAESGYVSLLQETLSKRDSRRALQCFAGLSGVLAGTGRNEEALQLLAIARAKREAYVAANGANEAAAAMQTVSQAIEGLVLSLVGTPEEAEPLLSASMVQLELQERDALVAATHIALAWCACARDAWERFDGHFDAGSRALSRTGFVYGMVLQCVLRSAEHAEQRNELGRARRCWALAFKLLRRQGHRERAVEAWRKRQSISRWSD